MNVQNDIFDPQTPREHTESWAFCAVFAALCAAGTLPLGTVHWQLAALSAFVAYLFAWSCAVFGKGSGVSAVRTASAVLRWLLGLGTLGFVVVLVWSTVGFSWVRGAAIAAMLLYAAWWLGTALDAAHARSVEAERQRKEIIARLDALSCAGPRDE